MFLSVTQAGRQPLCDRRNAAVEQLVQALATGFTGAELRIRAFTAGNIASFAVSIARGGLRFTLIILLQGSGSHCTATTTATRRCRPASSCCH